VAGTAGWPAATSSTDTITISNRPVRVVASDAVVTVPVRLQGGSRRLASSRSTEVVWAWAWDLGTIPAWRVTCPSDEHTPRQPLSSVRTPVRVLPSKGYQGRFVEASSVRRRPSADRQRAKSLVQWRRSSLLFACFYLVFVR